MSTFTNIKIVSDSGEIYPDGFETTAEALVSDYIDCCNEKEDADTINWLMETNIDLATAFVCDAWDLVIEYKK